MKSMIGLICFLAAIFIVVEECAGEYSSEGSCCRCREEKRKKRSSPVAEIGDITVAREKREWGPKEVCGSDNVTYVSSCWARECAVVRYFCNGPCNDTCTCNDDCKFAGPPVCGSDGRNYTSACDAQVCNDGTVSVACEGYCLDDGSCPPPCDYKCMRAKRIPSPFDGPVCGGDGRTYPNECIAKNCGPGSIRHPCPCDAPCDFHGYSSLFLNSYEAVRCEGPYCRFGPGNTPAIISDTNSCNDSVFHYYHINRQGFEECTSVNPTPAEINLTPPINKTTSGFAVVSCNPKAESCISIQYQLGGGGPPVKVDGVFAVTCGPCPDQVITSCSLTLGTPPTTVANLFGLTSNSGDISGITNTGCVSSTTGTCVFNDGDSAKMDANNDCPGDQSYIIYKETGTVKCAQIWKWSGIAQNPLPSNTFSYADFTGTFLDFDCVGGVMTASGDTGPTTFASNFPDVRYFGCGLCPTTLPVF